MKMLNTINKKNERNRDNKGFTLIELLAAIAILSVIMSIVIYVAINVVNNAKKKSYEVTVNNIEKIASSYVFENQSKMYWIDINDAEKKQYICVTVQDLIDMGYFKGDVLDSYIEKDVKVNGIDQIYLQRDSNSKSIEKEILLSKNSSNTSAYVNLCNIFDGIGRINTKVEPSGWSKSKDITVTYEVKNDSLSNFKYKYEYKNVDNYTIIESDELDFDSNREIEKINVTENGTLFAKIFYNDKLIASSSINITNIDNEGPIIEKGNYKGSSSVNNSVVIPLKVTDIGIGVDGASFTLEDLIINIGDKVITNGVELIKNNDNNYDLLINNSIDSGKITIIIDNDKVFDKLENPNDKTVIDTGISFNNKYMISYNSNGGSGTIDNQIFGYGFSVSISSNKFIKEGYTFVGWTTNSNGTDDGYNWTGWNGTWKYTNGEKGINNNKLVLYARWEDKTAPTTPSITTIYDLWGSRNYTVTGYSSDAGVNGTWVSINNDPIIEFNNIGNISGVNGAYVELEEALTKDIVVQIFYEKGTNGFNSINQEDGVLLPAGQTELYIPITKSGNWTKIRFDIGAASGISYKIKHLGVSATAGQWNNDGIIVRLSTTESGSGIKYWQYWSYDSSLGSNRWYTYTTSTGKTTFNTGAFTAERNEYVEFRACDNKDNCSASTAEVAAKNGSGTYIRIDKTKPTISNLVYAYNLFPTKPISGSNQVTISGTKITTTGIDPYIYFSGLNTSSVTKAIITFNTAVSSKFSLQTYYAKAGEVFNSNKYVNTTVEAGSMKAIVTLPSGSYSSLRFDFGGVSGLTFNITGIDIVGNGISNVKYILADIKDATNKVSGVKVSQYSTTPTEFGNFTDINDIKTYHLRNRITKSGKFYVWGIDNVGSGNISSMSSITVPNDVYTITYDLKGGTAGASSPTSGTSGTTVTVSNPTKGGYTFTGWTVSGTGASVSGTSLKIGTSNITLTANWTANLVEYIQYLYNNTTLRANNFLEKDNTGDANIRYVNSNPKNYVKFNGELWRIIGTFNVSNGSTTTKRAKLIRNSSLISASWDSSASNINNGRGVNEWSQADIKKMLNNYYAGSSSSCTYCNNEDQTSCSNSCTSAVSKLNSTALGMIENTVWNVGAIRDNPSALTVYNNERSSTTGKNCSYPSDGDCTDSVSRTKTWTGKVGLIYVSDYGFASTNSSCRSSVPYNANCQYKNWLSTGSSYWTLTPRTSSYFANAGYYVGSTYIGDTYVYSTYGIRPSVYLKSSVNVVDGDGTSSNPYILK